MLLRHSFFQHHSSPLFFGESRKVYIESQPTPEEVQSAPATATEEERTPDIPNQHQEKPKRNITEGPIPTIMGHSKGLRRNILGAMAFPIEAGIRSFNLAFNTALNTGKFAWKGSKIIAPRVWERVAGTPDSRDQKHPGLGAVMNPIYYGGVKNVQRLAYSALQTIQSTRSLLFGVLEGVGSATAKVSSGTIALSQMITSKPLAWLTSKIPGINQATQWTDNIIQNTRNQINTTGTILGEYAKQDFNNIKENTGATIRNIKGGLLSPLESTMRFGTAVIGAEVDMAIGNTISKIREKIQKSTALKDAVNPFQKKKNFAGLRA